MFLVPKGRDREAPGKRSRLLWGTSAWRGGEEAFMGLQWGSAAAPSACRVSASPRQSSQTLLSQIHHSRKARRVWGVTGWSASPPGGCFQAHKGHKMSGNNSRDLPSMPDQPNYLLWWDVWLYGKRGSSGYCLYWFLARLLTSQSILIAILGRYGQAEYMVRWVEMCLAVAFKEY